MSFTKTFPMDIGTFVITDTEINLNNPENLKGNLGSISCYQCVDDKEDEYIVVVCGYKDSWCGEYLLSKLKIATDKQVKEYEKIMGIK
nr:hypothetical protein [uncultured Lachnoclostridium sp.]